MRDILRSRSDERERGQHDAATCDALPRACRCRIILLMPMPPFMRAYFKESIYAMLLIAACALSAYASIAIALV